MMRLTLLSFGIISSSLLFGQSLHSGSISATRSTVASQGLILSSTIGQTNIMTAASGAVVLFEGFEQPSFIENVVGQKDLLQKLKLSAFPNPTTEFVNIEGIDKSSYNAQLFDPNGKLLSIDLVEQGANKVKVGHLPVGSYYLKIADMDGRFTVLKIVKND